MKPLFILLFSTLCIALFGQNTPKTEIKGKTTEATFWVNGNCDMCKKRIEKALDQPGIKFAEYKPQSKELFVAFRNDKYTLLQIHEIIAAAGHDTKMVKADAAVYNKLHHCCTYEREPLNTK